MYIVEEKYSLKASINSYECFLKNSNKYIELVKIIGNNIGRPMTKAMIQRDISLIENIRLFLMRDFNINDIDDIKFFLENFINRGSFTTFIYPFLRRMYVFRQFKDSPGLLDPLHFRAFANNLITGVTGSNAEKHTANIKYIANIDEIQQIMDMIDNKISNNVERRVAQHSLAIFLIFAARKHDVFLPKFRNDCFFHFLAKADKENELLETASTTFWKKFSKYICDSNENFIKSIRNDYFLKINSILEEKFFKHFNITFKALRRTSVNYKYFELLEEYKFNDNCIELAMGGIMNFLERSKSGIQQNYLYSFEEYKQAIENDIKKEI